MTYESILEALQQAIGAMSIWEGAAVILGVAYLLLAMRESIWCWPAAFASTAIFLLVFWQVNLIMESALQVYYLAMAVYGWRQWSKTEATQPTLAISRWNIRQHALCIGSVILASAVSGSLLQNNTSAAMPYLDSFTTWGSVITTWMVARKILENWLYWLVIDAVSIVLYIDRELYLTALLFFAYVIIVIFGYRTWLRHYRTNAS